MEPTNANTPIIPGLNLAKNKDKVSLFAFGAVQQGEPVIRKVGEQEIKVWETIPYEQVLDAIQWAINYILDDRTFISAPLNAIISDITIVKYWSNLDCSEVDDIDFDATRCYEFYDALQHFGIIDAVSTMVQPKQIQFFENNLRDTLNSLVAYRNSAAGLLEQLHSKANKDEMDLTKAMEMLQDPQHSGVLANLFSTFGEELIGADTVAPE